MHEGIDLGLEGTILSGGQGKEKALGCLKYKGKDSGLSRRGVG